MEVEYMESDQLKLARLGVCTVFERKLHTIELCLRELPNKEYKQHIVYILSDSIASLLAISAEEIKSKLALECL